MTYAYRPFGRLWQTTATKNASHFVVSSTLDEFGNPYRTSDPDRGLTVTSFNDFGELVFKRRNTDPVESRVYDLLGRLIRRNGVQDGSTTYEYDRARAGVGQFPLRS